MNLHTTILTSGLLIYFSLLLACIYHDNKFQLLPIPPFPSLSSFLKYIQHLPLSGNWTAPACQGPAQNCRGGVANGLFGTLYQLPSAGGGFAGSLALVVLLMSPQFYDEPYREIIIGMQAEGKGFSFPKGEGRVYLVEQNGFYAAGSRSFNATLAISENFLEGNVTGLRGEDIASKEVLIKMKVAFAAEPKFEIEFSLSNSGPDLISRILTYSLINFLVLGANISSSLSLFFELQTDSLLAASLSTNTIFLVLCQDTLFFVLNIALGIFEGSSAFALLALLPAILTCVDCVILLKAWMASELNRNFEARGLGNSISRYFCLHAKLYILQMGYIYSMMRFFLDVRLVALGGLLLLPQLVKNARRAAPPVFAKNFLMGFTSLKFGLFLYLRGCPENFPIIRYYYTWPFVGLALIILCIFLARLQFLYGSKVLLPKFMKGKTHQYFVKKTGNCGRTENSTGIGHNSISENTTLNISSQSNENGLEIQEEACSICQEKLEKIAPQNESGEILQEPKSEFFKNCLKVHFKNFLMVTPCKHRFHCGCLLSWMEVKMVCPICRGSLPSIE